MRRSAFKHRVALRAAFVGMLLAPRIAAAQTPRVELDHGFRAATNWRANGQSPFGFGLHRLAGDTDALRVPVRREPAPWLGPGEPYELLQQPSDSLAADLFVVPARAAVPRWMPRVRERTPEDLRHPGGGHEITLVRLRGREKHQPAALPVLRPGRIQFERASSPLLEVYVDGGVSGRRVDLRPILPVVLLC